MSNLCAITHITWPTPSICTYNNILKDYTVNFQISGMSLYKNETDIYTDICTLFYFIFLFFLWKDMWNLCYTLHSIFLTLILIPIILIFYIKFFFAYILLSCRCQVKCALYKHICSTTYVMEANNITRCCMNRASLNIPICE